MSSRLCRRRAVVAAAGLLLVAGVARAAGLAPDAAGPDPAAVNTLLNVTDSEIVTLDIDTTYGVPVQFVLPVEGEALPLDLEPFSVRAEGYRLLEDRGDGFLHEVDPGPINTLRGVVIGLEGSICAGGMMPDGLYLTVLLPDDTSSCGALDQSPFRDSAVSAVLSPGQTVLIRVSRFGAGAAGPFILRVEYPGNDACANALPVGVGDTPFCNIGATTDGPTESGTCSQSNDIWYRFFAPCTAPMRVSTCDANYDTEIAIYPGVCPTTSGTVLACNDDSCGFQSNVTFPATAGIPYLIRVGGFSAASAGSGTLRIFVAGDWNNDGSINSTDISAYLTAWIASVNQPSLNADFNNDGLVNSSDISAFLTAWIAAVNDC